MEEGNVTGQKRCLLKGKLDDEILIKERAEFVEKALGSRN